MKTRLGTSPDNSGFENTGDLGTLQDHLTWLWTVQSCGQPGDLVRNATGAPHRMSEHGALDRMGTLGAPPPHPWKIIVFVKFFLNSLTFKNTVPKFIFQADHEKKAKR